MYFHSSVASSTDQDCGFPSPNRRAIACAISNGMQTLAYPYMFVSHKISGTSRDLRLLPSIVFIGSAPFPHSRNRILYRFLSPNGPARYTP